MAKLLPMIFVILLLILGGFVAKQKVEDWESYKKIQTNKETLLRSQLERIKTDLDNLKKEDQRARNDRLENEIKSIQETYGQALTSYERLLDLKTLSKNTDNLDKQLAQALKFLSDRNYSSASGIITSLNAQIQQEKEKALATLVPVTPPAVADNNPPGSGFRMQSVQTDGGQFTVAIVAADLGGTRVIVDTASDNDCGNNCPVMPLGNFVARSGAYAGVNGSYFCPASYPSCAGKTNSFDLLVMNKNKHYFNSSNNVYSTNPAVIFGGGWIRFVGKAQEWGRDTGVDGVISNFPMLVQDGNIAFGGDGDAKHGVKGGRSFVANKGNTVFIGVVLNATVAEAAKVHKALGMGNALNLDDGGSVALWSGGYKLGPGRDIPNAVLFVRK